MAKIEIIQADITTLDVAAIVNAANPSLLGGGGVDGAIHRAAGPGLLAACREIPQVTPGVRCPTGKAVITDAFELLCDYVIHTVGPIWQDGHHQEAEQLAQCYRNSLKLAEQYRLASIAFPAISCGVYGYPVQPACEIAWNCVRHFPAENIRCIKMVTFNAAIKQHLDDLAASEN